MFNVRREVNKVLTRRILQLDFRTRMGIVKWGCYHCWIINQTCNSRYDENYICPIGEIRIIQGLVYSSSFLDVVTRKQFP